MQVTRHFSASLVSLNFEEQEELTSKELSEFLYRFRLVYGASIRVAGRGISDDMETLLANRHHLRARVRHELASRDTAEQYKDFYLDNLGNDELVIEKLRKESPFMMIFAGVFAAVALAAILSGGRGKAKEGAEGFEFEFDLPPIADGLRKLREVFRQRELEAKEEESLAEAAAPDEPPEANVASQPAEEAAESSRDDDEEERKAEV